MSRPRLSLAGLAKRANRIGPSGTSYLVHNNIVVTEVADTSEMLLAGMWFAGSRFVRVI
jgi:hypothetical protein